MQIEAKTNSKRLLFLDVAKFISIVLVVYCHSREHGFEINLFHAFHLPLFFIINGMTFRIHEGESTGDFLVRKIKTYIIPFIILALMVCTCETAFQLHEGGGTLTWQLVVDKLVDIYQSSRPYPLWFVLALFFSDIWLYLFIKWSFKKDWLVFIYSVISITLIITYYKYTPHWLSHSFDPSFAGVFFVTLGWLFYRNWNEKPRNWILNSKLKSLIIGLVLFAGCFGFVYLHYITTQPQYKESFFDMWGNNYQPFYLRIPAAILGGFGVIFLSNAIVNKPMAYMGKHTLVILAFQQNLTIHLFKKYIAKGWYQSLAPLQWGHWDAIGFTLVCTLFSLAVLIPLSILLTETHCAYAFYKKPAQWYRNLLAKIKSLFTKKKEAQ